MPIASSVVAIIDERTLRDGTVIVLEGCEDLVRVPGTPRTLNVAGLEQAGRTEWVWRWLRVPTDAVAGMLSDALHNGIMNSMICHNPETPGQSTLVENGSFYEPSL